MNSITSRQVSSYDFYYNYDEGYNKESWRYITSIKELRMMSNPYPHKITYDEFIQNNNYSKVNLIWYEQSNVFATVGDELTDYTEEYFGVHNINEFGASSNSGYGHDAWTLVLRDELTKTDFQIIYNGDDDWETVLANTGGDHSD